MCLACKQQDIGVLRHILFVNRHMAYQVRHTESSTSDGVKGYFSLFYYVHT